MLYLCGSIREKMNDGKLDLDLGNRCSKTAFSWATKTFKNRDQKAGALPSDLEGGFANMMLFGDQRIGIGSDGIGTKIELAERTKIFNTIGFDLVAMVADDLATAGFEPTSISNILDVDFLKYSTVDQLMQGLHDAANFSNMSVTGGEIAELGSRISGYGDGMHFNWCSTAIGILPKNLDRPIDGSNIKVGDAVISLKSRGFRSNGFSFVRAVMQQVFGDEWHKETYNELQTWGEVLLTPSLIYAPIINRLIEIDLIPAGIAHITGGGIVENFERTLKRSGLGAELNNVFPPLEMMHRLMKIGDVSLEDAYRYWNMGNGMLLVVDANQVETVLEQCHAKSYPAILAGEIRNGGVVLSGVRE